MIDARTHHDPAAAPGLVARAIEAAGTQRELAARCGVTRDSLRKIARGDRGMSYAMQVLLERIIAENS